MRLGRSDGNREALLFDSAIKLSSGSPAVSGKNQDVMIDAGFEAVMHATLGYTMSEADGAYGRGNVMGGLGGKGRRRTGDCGARRGADARELVVGRRFRKTSCSLAADPKTVTTSEIRSDRQVTDLILVDQDACGVGRLSALQGILISSSATTNAT
jgi:hypothetical protein